MKLPSTRRYVRRLVQALDWVAATLVLGAATVVVLRFVTGGSLEIPAPDIDAAEQRHEFLRLAWDGQWVGPKDAPVVMVVYSNYGCGFCVQLHSDMTRLRTRYPQHFAYVVKHFVDSEDSEVFDIAMAAECAADQEKFETFNSAAFEKPDLLRRL